MQYWKKNYLKYLAILCLAAVLVLCWRIGAAHDGRQLPAEPGALPGTPAAVDDSLSFLKITALDRGTDAEGAAVIDLDQAGESPVISEGGLYSLRGDLDGTLVIRAEDQIVHLVLDSVSIHSKTGPALWVESAGKVIITLAPGSENYLSDSADYRQTSGAEACITASCDLSINGSGSLSVFAGYKDAVRTNDTLHIVDGTISVQCKRTGFHAADGIHVDGGQITVMSEKNGFRTTKSGPDGRGSLVVSGGDLNIIAGRYSFICDKGDLYIYDCSVQEKSVVSMAEVGGSSFILEDCFQ